MSAFIIDISYANHRLLHASIQPPEVPRRAVLQEMERLALSGLPEVLEQLDEPIVRHIGRQALIAAMPEDNVWEALESGLYVRVDKKGEEL